MVKYVSYDPPRGIKKNGEIARSRGLGWILCKIEEELKFCFIHGGNRFLEDSILLIPKEIQYFEKEGTSYLDELYHRILMNIEDFSSRFLEKMTPEFIYTSQVICFDDENKNLGVVYYYMEQLYTGSVFNSDQGIVLQEWVLNEGEIKEYIKYGKDGRPETVHKGPDSIRIIGPD
jgi:hypothetical protein